MDWHLFSPLRCIGMCRRMFGFLEQGDLLGRNRRRGMVSVIQPFRG